VNLTSIALPPGDWNVSLVQKFIGAGGSLTVDRVIGSISATSGMLDSSLGRRVDIPAFGLNTVLYADPTVAIPPRRFTVATTTTIYAIGFSNWGGSGASMTMHGNLSARRAR
jgi:hypothetical protein